MVGQHRGNGARWNTSSGYAAVRESAVEAGLKLRDRQHWDARMGDFAEEFARTWGGGRLALNDPAGTEIAVASVMIVDGTRARHGPRVIVDARPDLARIEAFLRTIGRDEDGRSRPAA